MLILFFNCVEFNKSDKRLDFCRDLIDNWFLLSAEKLIFRTINPPHWLDLFKSPPFLLNFYLNFSCSIPVSTYFTHSPFRYDPILLSLSFPSILGHSHSLNSHFINLPKGDTMKDRLIDFLCRWPSLNLKWIKPHKQKI